MSRVARGISRGVRRVARVVKNNWKPIVMVGAALFTAGIATVGMAGFQGAMASGNLLTAVGSTIKAGAGSLLGTVGVGSGASGVAASSAGMQGATLLTGAGAQSLGLASQAVGPTLGGGATSAVGTYTGPGAGLMGSGGSLMGGGANAGGQVVANQAGQAAGGGFLRNAATAAVPALIQGVGAAKQAKAEQEAARGKAGWGVDHGGQAMQPDGLMAQGQFTGPDGQQYEMGPDGQPRPIFMPNWQGAPPSVNNPIWQDPGHLGYMRGAG